MGVFISFLAVDLFVILSVCVCQELSSQIFFSFAQELSSQIFLFLFSSLTCFTLLSQRRFSLIVFHDSGTLNIKKFSVCTSVRPRFFLCKNVCHATQFSPVYVTQPRILRCMSHHPVFSDVCHTAQNSPMYVTPPSFLQYMSRNPKFSNVCHTTQFSLMYVTQPRILRCM